MTVISPAGSVPNRGIFTDGSFLLGRLSAAGIAAVWMIAAARQLDIVEFGDLALAAAIAMMAVQLADGGVSVHLPRQMTAAAGGAGHIRSAVRRRIRFGLPAALGTVVLILVSSEEPLVGVAVAFGISVVATSIYGALATGLRVLGIIRPETVIEPMGRLLVLGLGSAALASGEGLAGVAASYAVGDVLVLTAYGAVAHRAGGLRRMPTAEPLGSGGSLAVTVPLAAIYWRVDTWLIGVLSTGRQVALYGAAYRLLDAVLIAPVALSSLLLARSVRQDGASGATVARYAAIGAAMSAPLVLASAFAAAPLLRLIYGSQYEAASTILTVLAVAAVISGATVNVTAALAAVAPDRYGRSVVAVFGINVGANLVVVPGRGAIGAAWVTLASQAVFLGIQTALLRDALAARARLADEEIC